LKGKKKERLWTLAESNKRTICSTHPLYRSHPAVPFFGEWVKLEENTETQQKERRK
jgi:hypothetical protein